MLFHGYVFVCLLCLQRDLVSASLVSIICISTTSIHAASLNLAFIISEGFLRWAHVAHMVQATLELTM